MDEKKQYGQVYATESKNVYIPPEPPKKRRGLFVVVGTAIILFVFLLGLAAGWRVSRELEAPVETEETAIETEVESEQTAVEQVTNHTHVAVVMAAVEPTCAETGLTEGQKCADCDEVLEEQVVIPTLEHVYAEWIVDKQPEIGVEGSRYTECTNCGSIQKNAIEMLYSEGLTYGSKGDGTCYVNGVGTCKDKVVAIPPTHNGEKVTSIMYHVFNGCTDLTSVIIPDGVTSIGLNAFFNCVNLTSVVLPDSVTEIGRSAFYGCSSLTSIVLPARMTGLEDSVFCYCTGLTSVDIPDGVTAIGNSAFYGCSGLTSIVLPDSVTSIGDAAFYECTGLTSIVIPDGVTSIGALAFRDCSSLTSIVIPHGVTRIGDSTFTNCSDLNSIVIPDSVVSIGGFALAYCPSLTVINYTGTEAEWSAIVKGSEWYPNTQYSVRYDYVP